MKEVALAKLQVVQETKEADKPFIAHVVANTITETSMVSSPSIDLSQEHLGEFEKHTKGIHSKLLRQMGYNGQGLGKRSQEIISTIIAEPRVKHEGLGFCGTEEKAISTKVTLAKEKNVADLACSSKEWEVIK
jgi:hypothetical protein